MSQIGFLFLGYAVVWVALASYFIAVGRRQLTLRREVERLEREMRAQG
ncbi:MAG: CcmD family protein [Thermoleophilia bacterium]